MSATLFKSLAVATLASAEIVTVQFEPIAEWDRSEWAEELEIGETRDKRERQINFEELTFDTADLKNKKTLGAGAFGTTYRAKYQNSDSTQQLVVKVISLDQIHANGLYDSLLNEIELGQLFTVTHPHPSVGKCFGVAFDERTKIGHNDKETKRGEVYIVMPLIKGQELYKINNPRNKRLSKQDSTAVAAQFVSAVAHMHKHHVMYRDIKPENALYDLETKQLTIIDFGFAVKLTEEQPTRSTMCGTPMYLSPDIIRREDYSYASDVWSGGVFLFDAFSGGYSMFNAPHVRAGQQKNGEVLSQADAKKRSKQLLYLLINQKDQASLNKYISAFFKNLLKTKEDEEAGVLIRKMLMKNPEERITFEQLENSATIKKWMSEFQLFNQQQIEKKNRDGPSVSHGFVYKFKNNKVTTTRDHAVYTLTNANGDKIEFRYKKWVQIAKTLNKLISSHAAFAIKTAKNAFFNSAKNANDKSALDLNKAFSKDLIKNNSMFVNKTGDAACNKRDMLILQWYRSFMTLAELDTTGVRADLFNQAVADLQAADAQAAEQEAQLANVFN